MAKEQLWVTDRDGLVYTEDQWNALLKERREGWRGFLGGVQVLAYVVAFLGLGIPLLVEPNVDNRTEGLFVGACALAFGLGVTIGRYNRPEPEHTTTHAKTKPEPPADDG